MIKVKYLACLLAVLGAIALGGCVTVGYDVLRGTITVAPVAQPVTSGK